MKYRAIRIAVTAIGILLQAVAAGEPPQTSQTAQPQASDPVPPPTEAELRERVQHWIQKLKRSGDPIETERFRKNLIALGKPAVPIIVQEAQNEFGDKPQPYQVWNVCLTLGRMADERAVMYLIKCLEPVPELELKKDPDWNYVRAFAALSLGKIPDPAHVAEAVLRKVLRSEKENSYVRRMAALAMGSLQDEGALDTMSKILLDPKSQPAMRSSMAKAIGMIHSEPANARLLEYLALDARQREFFTDRTVVQALGMQKYAQAVDPLLRMLAVTDDNSLKGSGVLVLSWIGNREATADIQSVMQDEQVPAFTRCNAAVALGCLGKPDVGAAFLRKSLQSGPNKIALGTEAYALISLGQFFAEDNIPVLYDAINSTPFSVVAINAVNSLGHYKEPRIVPFLIQQYSKFDGARNQYLRGEIIRALMAYPTQEAIRNLCVKGLKDSAEYVQVRCAVALARYPGADTDAALIEALSDRSPDVRGEVALSLGLLKSPKATEPLRKLLQDESDWVRLRSRRALENILKYGKNEFQQAGGLQDLVDQRTKSIGAGLSEEMKRLYAEGDAKVFELENTLSPAQEFLGEGDHTLRSRPMPPTPPAFAPVAYYATGGNLHAPVTISILKQNLDRYDNYDDSGDIQNEELRNYFNSREYQEFKAQNDQWKKDSGQSSQQFNRDLKNANATRDLASWFRGRPYHDPVNAITYSEAVPEVNASLKDPLLGPALTASHYAKLVSMLNESAQKQAPSPKELITSIEAFWESQWRRNLGFDIDPTSRQLIADLERAMNDTQEARRRLEGLNKRAETNEIEKFQLMEQRTFAGKEMERCQAKEQPLRELFERRLTFVRAIVNLLRLAPEGGFGPTFAETAEPKSVQAAAAKILVQIGPLAASPIWQGLTEDLAWLRQVKGGGENRPEGDLHNRTMAAEAAEGALCDTRIEGLAVVSEFLISNRPAPAEVLIKALELLDKLGTKSLRTETLSTLPRVIALRKHDNPEVATEAKWVLLRLMGVSGGKASLEDAIGYLAPLMKDPDAQLTEAVWRFLNTNTGQHLPKDSDAWLKLQKRMISEREKAEAEKKKIGVK